MKSKLILGLLILVLVVAPLLAAACDGGDTDGGTTDGGTTDGGTTDGGTTDGGDWWDVFGEPQYGGTLTVRTIWIEEPNLDPQAAGSEADFLWCDTLMGYDWAVDRDECSYNAPFVEPQYYRGMLAESWEQTDPLTYVVHLRQGVYWQDKPPTNGREFTAYDVQYNYDRLLGTGNGFTEPSPLAPRKAPGLERVVAIDDYTVQFTFKSPSVFGLDFVGVPQMSMLAPELAEQGLFDDWHNAVGTGAWMLTEFVEGTSLTFSSNPNYWGYDERHPQNQLPYFDEVKLLAIADESTAIAAMRTGTVDSVSWFGMISSTSVENLLNTNPEIQEYLLPSAGQDLELRVDHAPFTDIRVRKALQMAIDLELIAETHLAGVSEDTPCGLIAPVYEGYCFSYEDWSQELKDEYSFNPEAARQLLAEAAADGVFEPNEYGGFDTNVVVAMGDDIELLQIIQSYFMDIGVVMDIETLADVPTFLSFCGSGQHDQMAYTKFNGILDKPWISILRRHSTRDPFNLTHCADAYYDDLVSQFETAATVDEARQLCSAADQYALEQHWTINTLFNYSRVCVQPWIMGYSGEIVFQGPPAFYFSRLWIDQALKESMGD